MRKIGYVLSGGGARGFAHLGVLKFLDEIGFKPYAIAGTSAGAIAGALYASGLGPQVILNELKNSNFFGWSSFRFRQEGFFSMDPIRQLLSVHLGEKTFESLEIKLFIATTDLTYGQSIIISSGEVSRAVIASSSIPVLFEPVKDDDRMLIDGGVLNNFPLEPLQGLCDLIVGSYVNRISPGYAPHSRIKALDLLDRCFHISSGPGVYAKSGFCNVFLDIPLDNFDMHDVSKAEQIFEAGYAFASLHHDELTNLAAG
jgi:NTE family protein